MTTGATYTETGLVTAIEQLAGKELASLSPAQLNALDQFHAGGAEAVDRLLPSLGLRPGMTALDIGSGLGGPARQVARSTGCVVVGVDTSKSYVDTARALTQATRANSNVSFIHGQVTDVERDDFDAAYTMHVQMNVPDKHAFFRGIASRLRSGASLATFDVCLSGPENPALPLPWSLDGSDSFLTTSDDLLMSIEGGGFAPHEWVDETAWVLQWFKEVGAASPAQGTTAVLPALLTDGPARMMNFAHALHTGILTIHRGSFARS